MNISEINKQNKVNAFVRQALAAANTRVSASRQSVEQIERQMAQLKIELDAAKAAMKAAEKSRDELSYMADEIA